jgi:hypothetical protein
MKSTDELTDAERERLSQLPSDILGHLASLARERERAEASGIADWFEREDARLTEQAKVARVAHDMVVEDGLPAEMVIQCMVAEFPHHAGLIAAVVAESEGELVRVAA